jgi:ubiquinone biosynthesis monooxygenase Coq7
MSASRLRPIGRRLSTYAQLPIGRRLSTFAQLSTPVTLEYKQIFASLAACREEISAVHRAQLGAASAPYKDDGAQWSWLDRELSSNVAGETGAVCIYEGAAAALRLRGNASEETRAFIEEHRAAEAAHLELFLELLPSSKYTRLLPAWRMAGFCLGFAPALVSDRWLFLTVEAVETFVEEHYTLEQIHPLRKQEAAVSAPHLIALLEHCCADEVHHKEDAAKRAGEPGAGRTVVERAWMAIVRVGSAVAAEAARRL